MNGILIIDKPSGMTSHDVVARVRRVLGTRRVGHTGTLDPFATGVLVLLVGNATRLAQFVDKDVKEYEALIKFGFETDTGDLTGKEKAEGGMHAADAREILRNVNWELVLAKFRGPISQTPPMYSAKKLEGKKLYELARAGVEVERKPVHVAINRLEVLPDCGDDAESTMWIRVGCSAGTYIRTLAEDIGRQVGTGAHLLELRRTRAGRFGLDDAVGLEELQAADAPDQFLRPASDAVAHLPAIEMSSDRVIATKKGLATKLRSEQLTNGTAVRMLDEDSNLIAIGTFQIDEKSVKPKIVLV